MTPTPAKRAYEAYALNQSGKAHDGSPLPGWEQVAPHIREAWAAFAGAVMVGADLEDAYHRAYLGAVGGKSASGGPAPSMPWFLEHRPHIVAAWAVARLAVEDYDDSSS